jgi:hypothetical protein
MRLSQPKPRKTRKAAALAKCIGEPDERVQPWIGARVNGHYWIQATDGPRALLCSTGDPDARQVGFPLGEDSFTVSDPEFFNAVKRARILSTEECIRFTISGSWLILSSQGEFGDYSETFDIQTNGCTRDGLFQVNAKWLLESLGNWPLKVTYDASDPMTPILFESSEFAYILAGIKPGKE